MAVSCRYAKVKIGDPPQEIEMDLNMLVSDFYVITTTSRKGSRYDDFFSRSAQKSLDRPYPHCYQHTDLFTLPTIRDSLPLSFPYCRPSKFSRNTLGPSGSTLGLAPSEHLSQTGSVPLLKQLHEKEVIQHQIFSLMLINGQDGVLSVGGTAASAIDMVVSQTENALNQLSDTEKGDVDPVEKSVPLVKRGRHGKEVVTKREEWETGWVWTGVQGAEGWWQLLMRGIWVDGSKVLQNQAVVIDACHHCLISFRGGTQVDSFIDKQPFHPCPTTRRQSFLRLCFRFTVASSPLFKFLRLPLPESTNAAFRVQWDPFSIYARGSWRRMVRHSGWQV